MEKIGLSRDIPMLREARERKHGFVPIVEVLIFLAVFLVGSMVESAPASAIMLGKVLTDSTVMQELSSKLMGGDLPGYMEAVMEAMKNQPAWFALVNLFATALMIVIAVLFCRVIQKRMPASMGFRRGHALREYLVGALIGAGLLSATVGIARLTGGISGFETAPVSVPMFILYLLGFAVQGASEEALCRGYLLVSITRRNQVWRAMLVSSLVFSLLHIMNPGFGVMPFINILLCGAVFGVYMLKRGNIWGACAMHSMWNFFQGNVFGISVSGTGAGGGATLLVSKAGAASDLWTGGAFGIEGSLACTFVYAAALVILLFAVKPGKQALCTQNAD